MNRLSILLIALIAPLALTAQSLEEAKVKGLDVITENVLRSQVRFLASDWTEGRETGERGEYMAADYIASMLDLFGVEPGGDYVTTRAGRERTYFQTFQLLKTSMGDDQRLYLHSKSGPVTKTTGFTYGVDYTFRNTTADLDLTAPVVFVGYGIRSDEHRYNDFRGKDVEGKIILRVSGVPQSIRDQATGNQVSVILRQRDAVAREMGAVGVIEVNPNNTVLTAGVEPRDFLDMKPAQRRPSSRRPFGLSRPQTRLANPLPSITASMRLANEIVRNAGFTIEEYLSNPDGLATRQFPEVSGQSIRLVSSVNTSLINTRNVIGVIEGKNPDEVIVVGAHYDHLGMHDGYIWNGADDNASGTVGAMTLAKAFMATGVQPEKTIVIALWTAEERGLLGSRYWVENPTVPIENVMMNINFDMIARYVADDRPNAVVMTYTESHELFRDITLRNMARHNIEIEPEYVASMNPPGGSDHRSFVAVGIPIMRFKAGHREEYHTPFDETHTLDWDIMEKVVKISFANIWDLANMEWR